METMTKQERVDYIKAALNNNYPAHIDFLSYMPSCAMTMVQFANMCWRMAVDHTDTVFDSFPWLAFSVDDFNTALYQMSQEYLLDVAVSY